MSNLFKSPGFLGTGAPFISDLSLILMLLTAVLFTIGWQMAVRRRYKAHRWVQTWAVLLNTVVVLIVMISSFVIFILPGIPSKLGEGSYGITTIHALLGSVSLILGVYGIRYLSGQRPATKKITIHKLQTLYADILCALYVGHFPRGGDLYCRIRLWYLATHYGLT
jgi:uncharacterized membrane protein YozB (DUF420 family)